MRTVGIHTMHYTSFAFTRRFVDGGWGNRVPLGFGGDDQGIGRSLGENIAGTLNPMLRQAFKKVGFQGALEGVKSYLITFGLVTFSQYLWVEFAGESRALTLHDAVHQSLWPVVGLMIVQTWAERWLRGIKANRTQ